VNGITKLPLHLSQEEFVLKEGGQVDLRTKCRYCYHEENCGIKKSLNEIIQKVIKRTEESVRAETSLDIDYIIITDVTVIPTACRRFCPKEKQSQGFPLPGIIYRDSLTPA